jgi:hypothetical protein
MDDIILYYIKLRLLSRNKSSTQKIQFVDRLRDSRALYESNNKVISNNNKFMCLN